ncbi:hypothetical protein B0H17DRAFT_1193175 [Mycena rosella]|uniref:Uncharacterized protein n=1 Tax=Mycena rosella TaxID=1033263 RepID=A0AAD7GUG5_MYCRO|nr:hypothetical protein B0H17DRAFT_1193175 [Mycena rosella]
MSFCPPSIQSLNSSFDSAQDWLQVPDVDSSLPYTEFKYRLWLTRYAMLSRIESPPAHQARELTRASWLGVVAGDGADKNPWLWLWEDGDEEFIKGLRPFGDYTKGFPEMDWVDACQALELIFLLKLECTSWHGLSWRGRGRRGAEIAKASTH